MLALWSMEKIVRKKIKVTDKKRKTTPLATNQVEQFQPLGQEKGKTYPISTATKAD